jgi:DNA polymerase-1
MEELKEKERLFLVDGSNYLYRAYYAIRDLSNSKGFPTNAIYGFTTMLMKLIRDWKPEHIVVIFDLKGPTARHETYDLYKATRKATPDTLITQIPYVKEIVRAFSVPVVEIQGIEADDIIGTLAVRFASQGKKVVLVSGDKDLMQLVSDDIIMMDTMKEKTYDVTAVKERFGVGPDKVPEILGLMGDSSDNIPGVPGIGAKGAKALIEEYGSIEGLIENVDKIKNAKAKKAIREFADQARMSRDLARIQTNVPVEFDLDAPHRIEPDTEALIGLFKEFEFSSLLQELRVKETSSKTSSRNIISETDFLLLIDRLKSVSEFTIHAVLSDPEPMKAQIVGIAISLAPGEVFYIPLAHDYAGMPEQLDTSRVLEGLQPFLTDEFTRKHGHDLKSLLIALACRDIPVRGIGCDTMVSAYILNPSRHSFELEDVAMEHLSRRIATVKDLAGSGSRAIPLPFMTIDKVREYASGRADAISRLVPPLMKRIDEEGFTYLFHEVETPLLSILADMERHGVLLDLNLLRDMSQELHGLLALSEEKIYRLAGERFNINSPKQLQGVLFDKLGLPKGRKTKEGYSTDSEVLSLLAQSHELPAEILAYRSLAKLKSTYIDALPLLVNKKTGRIHTSYNQTVTATGRLSSSNPNLQNIPIRTLEGKRIRQAFIAPDGKQLLSADYSQIELRILAHLSGDPALIEAFNSGEDIHNRTASDIFGVFPEMVNAEMRRQAKVINFGILYGMSAFGLAKELGLNQKMAQAYIDGYFQKYHGVKAYIESILQNAVQRGFVTTLLNRRRYLPDLTSSNAMVRQFAERTAVNTPIQGTAADLIKVAMIRIHHEFTERKLAAAMILQVHDELVFEVPEAEMVTVTAVVKKEMEEVVKLTVPLKVDIASGRNWDEAH